VIFKKTENCFWERAASASTVIGNGTGGAIQPVGTFFNVGTFNGQSQRALRPLHFKNLHQKLVVPSGDFAFFFDAVLWGMAFEQTDRDATQPRKIARREGADQTRSV